MAGSLSTSNIWFRISSLSHWHTLSWLHLEVLESLLAFQFSHKVCSILIHFTSIHLCNFVTCLRRRLGTAALSPFILLFNSWHFALSWNQSLRKYFVRLCVDDIRWMWTTFCVAEPGKNCTWVFWSNARGANFESFQG